MTAPTTHLAASSDDNSDQSPEVGEVDFLPALRAWRHQPTCDRAKHGQRACSCPRREDAWTLASTALDLGLQTSVYAVLAVLLMRAHAGRAFAAPMSTLCRETGYRPETVRLARQRLEAVGVLETVRLGGGALPNLYRLDVVRLRAIEDAALIETAAAIAAHADDEGGTW